MKTILITLLASFLTTIHAAQASTSFQDAATIHLPYKVEQIITALQFMNESTMPAEVKEVRKALGNVKIELDLYCPLFGDKKYKEVLKLREEIDQGYEVLGQFKDLYDSEVIAGIPADSKDVEVKRQAALKWRGSFNKFLAQSQVMSMLERPLSKARECLSPPKLLWDQVKDIPSANDSFDDVLSELITQLLKGYKKDQKKLLKLDDLFKYSDEERFHDFRKGVRTVLKLIDFYPQLAAVTHANAKLELEELIDQFGSINDLLVAYHKASGKKLKSLKEQIAAEWEQLQEVLEETDLDDLLINS